MVFVREIRKTVREKIVKISTGNQTIPKGINSNTNIVTLYFKDATEEQVNNFQYERDGRNLLIINGNKQTITIEEYFSNDEGTATKSKVKLIRYDKGNDSIDKSIIDEGYIHTDIDFVPKKGKVTGTIFSDTINIDSTTTPYKNKGYTINGGKGNDEMTGTQFNDTFIGGVGANIINYDFGKISGQDTIKLTKGEKLTLKLKNGEQSLGCEDVLYGKIGKDLIIYSEENSSTNALNIKKFFSTTSNISIGDEILTEYLLGADSALNILGYGKINGTKYGDNINGSVKNDTITAGLGNDTINTNGGKDTVVETGEYGHDTIESLGSQKVTVKLSSFDEKNISKDDEGNLIYTTDEKSGFKYNDFYNEESTAADLWIKSGKKSYHIVNNSADYIGSTNTKTANIVFGNGTNNYTYQGGKEIYIENEETADNYTATLTKSGALTIRDNGGVDNLALKNDTNSISLFFNTDKDGNIDNDLVIYNSKSMTYKNLSNSYKNDSYTGGIKLENYFVNGEIETVSCGSGETKTTLDMSGWKYYVNNVVACWLKENNKTSVENVLSAGTKKEKTALTTILKNLTYENYQKTLANFDKYSDIDNTDITENMLVKDNNGNLMTIINNSTYKLGNNNSITLNCDEKYSDINLVNENSVLKVYGKDNILLYTVEDFAGVENQNITFNVKDDNNTGMSLRVNPELETVSIMGNSNSITLNCDEKYSDINLVNDNSVLKVYGKDNVLLYTVEDFTGVENQNITFNVKDDNNTGMSLRVNPELETVVNLENNNQITFDENFSSEKVLSTKENSHETLVYTDKAYKDFYTKSSAVIAYNSGDPLIVKDGNDLKIGDTTVKNIDEHNSEIMIKDKNDETKTIIVGKENVAGTFESEIIVGSNSSDTITTNGGNDLIYMGGGNDTLNVTALEKDQSTGKNTAQMTGIGGTTTISDDLAYPALSVYDSSGNDTYNTSFGFGLYIEDYAGNDTLNIKYSDENIMYFFDVANPNKTGGTLYTDLMICDKSAFTTAITPIAMKVGMGMMSAKAALESLQGKFGYAWIDDYYGGAQKIETVNLVNNEGEVAKTFNLDYTDENSDVNAIYQSVSTWLSTKDYTTAWDVLENGSKQDMAGLLMLYMS